jgi:hypothetical protein
LRTIERGDFLSGLQRTIDFDHPIVGILNLPREWLPRECDPSSDADGLLSASGAALTCARLGWATYGILVPDEPDVEEAGRALLRGASVLAWRLALSRTAGTRCSAPDLIRALETAANEIAKKRPERRLFVLDEHGAVASGI